MLKMLVVDDEVDICDFVKHFFEERNYTVVTAHDGEQAVRAIRRQRFDIILLDIKMRKMDGTEALKNIKQFDKEAKVIMVTAMEDETRMKAASDLGACRYITKPLVLEELENAVYAETQGGNLNQPKPAQG